jgi:hypothetical protein
MRLAFAGLQHFPRRSTISDASKTREVASSSIPNGDSYWYLCKLMIAGEFDRRRITLVLAISEDLAKLDADADFHISHRKQ